MPKATARRAIARTSIEIRSFSGGNDPRKYYLLVKGRRKSGDFFQVFGAQQLKEACLDILGIPDTRKSRQISPNDLARRIWSKK